MAKPIRTKIFLGEYKTFEDLMVDLKDLYEKRQPRTEKLQVPDLDEEYITDEIQNSITLRYKIRKYRTLRGETNTPASTMANIREHNRKNYEVAAIVAREAKAKILEFLEAMKTDTSITISEHYTNFVETFLNDTLSMASVEVAHPDTLTDQQAKELYLADLGLEIRALSERLALLGKLISVENPVKRAPIAALAFE